MKKSTFVIGIVITAVICIVGTSYATYELTAKSIAFDREDSKLNSEDVQGAIDEIAKMVKNWPVYSDGTAIYYNPETNTQCDEATAVSTTGTKTGCMKWYVYSDAGNESATVNAILDHNTTSILSWNSSGNNADGMNEVKTALDNDTATWNKKLKARLISADDIAKITGADKTTTIKWSSKKTYGIDNPNTKSALFYFDATGTTYSNTNGWQKQTATTKGASKFAWLFDHTYGCTSYGCNIEDNNKYTNSGNTNYIFGYWTSTAVVGISNGAWGVSRCGYLDNGDISRADYRGIRPVITISKSVLS